VEGVGGQGPEVVLSLVDHADIQPGDRLTFDNLFTSIPLLNILSEKGIGGTGTMHQNRLHSVPLTKKKAIEKHWKRGDIEETYTADITVVAWSDNKPVYVASNVSTSEPVGTVRRWSRKEKKEIMVPQPKLILDYNKEMGGVDLLDQMVAAYRVRVRLRKWWWPVFAWTLSVQAVSAW
jgi:hypothetical protein